MSNPSSDSYRNVLKHTGQDYSFAPRYLRPRDPHSPTNASNDIKPKEQQGHYPLGSLWTTSTNGNLWALATITNNLANWILLSSGTSGPLIQFTGGTGTSGFPVNPNATGQVQLTSNNSTIAITGTTNSINFDLTGGAVAIEKFTPDTGTTPVVPLAGVVTVTNTSILATGTLANALRSNGTGANTIAYQTQYAGSNAASSTANNYGVSQFDANQFTVTSGFVQITSFTPFHYTQINNASSPYTVLSLPSTPDYFISVDSTAAAHATTTILLPNAPTTFRQFIIKDRTGKASTNNILISTVGGAVTIDGQTTYTMSGNFDSIQLLFNGTSYEIF